MDAKAIEDRVKARLSEEKSELDARAATLGDEREAAVAAHTKAGTARAAAVKKAIDAVTASKPVTDAVESKALDAMKDEAKALRAVIAVARKLDDAAAARKALDSKDEVKRRVTQAMEFKPDSDEPLTGKQAVALVLLRAGRPMHYAEITRVALQTGLLRTEGATPEATISAMLATRSLKGDTFRKVEPGIFDLLPVPGATTDAEPVAVAVAVES